MNSIEYEANICNVEFSIKVFKVNGMLDIRADSKEYTLLTRINPLKDEKLESNGLKRKVNKLVGYKYKESLSN